MDTKHLKRRAKSPNWYFQLAVPGDLQKRLGAKMITRSLGTTVLREAQRLRHEHLARELARFEALRNENREQALISTLSEAELKRQMLALYRRKIEAYRQRGVGDQEALGDAIGTIQEMRGSQGEWFSLIEGDMAAIPSHPQDYDRLARGLLRAELEALLAISDAEDGAPLPPPPPFLAPLAPLAPSEANGTTAGTPRVSDAARLYLEARQRDPSEALTQQTAHQMQATYRLLKDYTGDATLAEIDKATASGFLSELGRLGRTFGKSVADRGLTLEALLEKYGNGDGGPKLSNKTLARHATACRSLWRHAIGHGWLSGDNNPWSGLSIASKRRHGRNGGYVVPTDTEAVKLVKAAATPDMVTPAKHSVASAMAWLVPIAFLSGLRAEEAAGLRLEDVRRVDGVLVFDVNTDHRNLKTASAVRRVPVHPALIEMGLDRYLEHIRQQEHATLWPGLAPGGLDDKLAGAVTKRFVTLRRSVGIDRPGFAFHSARKWFGTALERVGVPQSTAEFLAGHAGPSGSRGMTFGLYSGGPSMVQLKQAVDSVKWPPAPHLA